MDFLKLEFNFVLFLVVKKPNLVRFSYLLLIIHDINTFKNIIKEIKL